MGRLPRLSSPSEAIARECEHGMCVAELVESSWIIALLFRHENDAKARAFYANARTTSLPLPFTDDDVLHTTILFCLHVHIVASTNYVILLSSLSADQPPLAGRSIWIHVSFLIN